GVAHLLVQRVVEDHVLVTGVPHFEHAAEEGGQAPELILAPGLIWMVVALRAIEPAAEEHADLFGHSLAGRSDHIVGKEVTRGTVVARGRQALASDLVVGLVGRDILADPLGVHTAPLGPYAVREDGHTEDVVETEGPVVDELGRADERVDQLFPLLRIAAGEKLTNATGRRKLAGRSGA